MIDIDVHRVYEMSHGRDKVVESIPDTIGRDAKNDVCRKLLELMQAFENLRVAILTCGDCVRLKVNLHDGVLDPMSSAAMMASIIDASSDARSVFLDTDDQMGIEDFLVLALHQAYDLSAYIKRISRRLRRRVA